MLCLRWFVTMFIFCLCHLALAASAKAQAPAPNPNPAPAPDALITCTELTAAEPRRSCFAQVYATLDVDVLAAYKNGLVFIDRAGLQPSLSRDWKRAYQETQRKWIALREADCGPLIIYERTGRGDADATQLQCKIARTRERLEVLKARYSPKK
jgi:uncharacterized protein YecT (DUF1311 family)